MGTWFDAQWAADGHGVRVRIATDKGPDVHLDLTHDEVLRLAGELYHFTARIRALRNMARQP